MLGMGVQRQYRRQGLARALYLGAGYTVTGDVADMFRIDGETLAYTFMTLGLRGA
jgi:hypothetical protein